MPEGESRVSHKIYILPLKFTLPAKNNIKPQKRDSKGLARRPTGGKAHRMCAAGLNPGPEALGRKPNAGGRVPRLTVSHKIYILPRLLGKPPYPTIFK
jgi:hypothetical protein